MKNKINIEEIKKYKRAVRSGQEICYICGVISPKCGMTPISSINLDNESITDTMCKECYDKYWNEALKSNTKIENIWRLGE